MKNWKKILLLLLLSTLLSGVLLSCRSAEQKTPERTAEAVQTDADFPRTGKDNITV